MEHPRRRPPLRVRFNGCDENARRQQPPPARFNACDENVRSGAGLAHVAWTVQA
jgi:hypothetical protein